MEAKLYVNKSDKNVLLKTLDSESTKTLTLKVDTTIQAPVFTLSSSNWDNSYNYIYIEELSRYYFIDKVVKLGGGIVELECTIDPLMSFREEILNLSGTIVRSESLYNGYLIDGSYQTYCYENIVTKKFPNAMENDSVILMTMG